MISKINEDKEISIYSYKTQNLTEFSSNKMFITLSSNFRTTKKKNQKIVTQHTCKQKIACRRYVGIFTEIASIWIFIQMDESITLDLTDTNNSSLMLLVHLRYIDGLKYHVQFAEESGRD